MHRVLVLYGGAAALESFFALISYNYVVIKAAGLLTVLMPCILIPICNICSHKKVPSARFFTAAITLFTVGAVLYGLKDFGVFDTFWLTEFPVVWGSAVELLLFGLALIYKMRGLDRERQQAEIENQKNQALATTSLMVAHDIKKPFEMLHNVVDTLHCVIGEEAMTEVPPQARPIIADSLHQIRIMQTMVNGMLADLREISGEVPIHLQPCKVLAIIGSALEKFAYCVQQQSPIPIDYRFHHHHLIMADALRLERVIINIVENALQAMNDKKSLWLDTSEDAKAGQLCLKIGNSGSSLPKHLCDKIFEAHFTRGKPNGMGLGLAIAKKIVEGHGGKISCQSNEMVPNVEVILTLPMAEETDAPSAVQLPKEFLPRRNGHQIRVHEHSWLNQIQYIVMVEDCPVIRNGWACAWGKEKIRLFNRPEDLLEANAVDPSLLKDAAVVVLDYHYGATSAMNGLDLAQRLRDEGFQKPIVLSSGAQWVEQDPECSVINLQVEKSALIAMNQIKNLVL
jgi:signal transduction histidine kinase